LALSHLALKNHSETEVYAQALLNTEDKHQYQPAIAKANKVLTEVNEHNKYYDQAFYTIKNTLKRIKSN